MSEKRACTECGISLPPDAPRGLCPRCLMGAAFGQTTEYRPPAPAATAVDFSEFRRTAIDAGLIDAETFDRYAAASPGDVARTARELARAGKLTAYQAGALAQGKGRGLVIGSYLVIEKLGQGGMGVVFKARRRGDERLVALKILPPSFGRDREAVMRFRREFEVAARLSHPNVVAAIDADEDRGVPFLTMEYIDGHDLAELVRAVGPLPIKLAVNSAIQAAHGLAAAHARGIVHRDIKPANLMLDASGQVKVLDLGLARIVEDSGLVGRTVAGGLTMSGSYMGTVDYMSPEQADDSKRADHRSDIYSLGCTLYFLLTGRPPFEGESALKRLLAHQEKPAPSLRAARNDVLAALDGAYQTMLAKRPDDRPRSMTEVIELLEASRSPSEEARGAREELSRAFAQTFLKRAAPRPTVRDRNASIFARPREDDGPKVNPDLKFEDLVMDLRPEEYARTLREDQLPPKMPRIAPPKARKRRRRPPAVAMWSLAVAALGLGAYAFFPRGATKREDVAPPVSKLEPAAPSADRGLLAWLDGPTPPDLRDSSLDGLIKFLKAKSPGGLRVYVDPHGLGEARKTMDSAVAIRAKDGPLKDSLQASLRPLGLSYVVKDGQLLTITSNSRVAQASQPESSPPAFVSLFNGRDLTGWTGDGLADHEVSDGAIRSKVNKAATIYVRKEFTDFVARVEFRLKERGNGGLAIRYPGSGLPSADGMCEIQVLDDGGYPNLDHREVSGSAYGLAAAKPGHLRPQGQWNVQEVTVRGSTIKVELNGVVVLDTDLAPIHEFMRNQRHPGKDRTSGYFGLANQNPQVEYRNVEIRELTNSAADGTSPSAFESLFNGRDLRGWHDDKGYPGVWAVEGGNLVVHGPGKDRQGYLLTDRNFVDFRLRFEVQMPRNADSGVGLWAQPGEDVGPVEINLRTFDKDQRWLMASVRTSRNGRPQDYAQPDHPAPWGPEGSWNRMEVEARDGRLNVWVNEQQIITDRDLGRLAVEPDASPAVRRRSGRIGFQAHTETVRFRNIKVEDLSASRSGAGLGPANRPDDHFRVGSVWTREEPEGTPTVGTFTVTARDGEAFRAVFDLGNHVREVTGTIAGGKIRWNARDARVIRGNQGHDNTGTIRGDVISMFRVGDARQASGTYVLRLKKP